MRWQAALAMTGLLGLLLLAKWPALALPYFMDEAWSYAPALRAMYDQGPSLLPGAIEPVYSRGHPLLFYALAGAWMRLLGPDLVSVHVFALMLTGCLLLATYGLVARLTASRLAGVAGAAVLAAQPPVFAQSVLALPEVLVALWATLAVWGWTERRWPLFAAATALLLLTKESGAALVAAAGLAQLLELRRPRRPDWWRVNAWIAASLVPVVLFFVLQYLEFGWVFYPDHLTMIERSPGSVLEKTWGILEYLFFNKGAAVSLFTALMIGVFFLFFKRKNSGIPVDSDLSERVTRFWVFSLLFAACYIGFSALNFLTMRYLLALYPLVVAGGIGGLVQLAERIPRWRAGLLAALSGLLVYVGATLWYTPDSLVALRSDTNMAYADMVRVHRQLVDECLRRVPPGQRIEAHFLTWFNLAVPACGYLPPEARPLAAHLLEPDSVPHGRWLALTTIEADSHRQALLADSATYRTVWHARRSAAQAWLLRRRAD